MIKSAFWGALRQSPFVMLCIADEELLAEPMTAFFDRAYPNTLFFFTGRDNRIVRALMPQSVALVHFVGPGHGFFASLRGPLSLCDDISVREHFWDASVASWYRDGLHDPTLRMLRVNVTHGEFWETDTSIGSRIKALLTDGARRPGERHVVQSM